MDLIWWIKGEAKKRSIFRGCLSCSFWTFFKKKLLAFLFLKIQHVLIFGIVFSFSKLKMLRKIYKTEIFNFSYKLSFFRASSFPEAIRYTRYLFELLAFHVEKLLGSSNKHALRHLTLLIIYFLTCNIGAR